MIKYTNPGNCKLITIDGINGCQNNKAALDELLKGGHRLTAFFVTTRDETMEFIKKNYKVIFCNKVPIGYGAERYNYHMLIQNPFPNGQLAAGHKDGGYKYQTRIDGYIKEQEAKEEAYKNAKGKKPKKDKKVTVEELLPLDTLEQINRHGIKFKKFSYPRFMKFLEKLGLNYKV